MTEVRDEPVTIEPGREFDPAPGLDREPEAEPETVEDDSIESPETTEPEKETEAAPDGDA